LHGHAVGREVSPGRVNVAHAQGEVTGAQCVRLLLEQQVQVLVAQIEPDHDEIKCPRPGDLSQSQQIAVKAPAALHVSNDYRAVVDLGDVKHVHSLIGASGWVGSDGRPPPFSLAW